ncbi:M23 family metallopeptidase [Parasphingorhabdus cellanae]|uniref:Peptidoglycan DD-metalloendopeptidase family protein n=1 Tax=Parasphingorhabdus cellanae TaxID=2806553 RepID=A0ABX7T1J3_9SPHN|nr:M23 family metallopeptidase [Parasphingorhabdus cellanae]QTD54637.1 peptidoglycan DD-metalloendopeptidase family protein [Parasphingorhabdus cellanae]
MQIKKTREGLLARLDHMFTDREFFMRANGQVRFLTISGKLQKRVAMIVSAIVGLWLIITLAMTVNQLTVTSERMALAEKEAAVNSSQSRVAEYKKSIDGVAQDLIQRQDAIEQITQQFIGEEAGAEAETLTETEKKLSENTKKISAAFPEAAELARLEARQIAFAQRLTRAAMKRTERAEAAIREFGLNPKKFAASSTEAVGGPYIPFFADGERELHPTLERLNNALLRMDQLERTLLTIPSAMPADITMMSSGYGYRRDPFTGGGAMHSGIDFKGPHGQPILSAAGGKITHAGWKSGYGKTVEVTHGNGLMTRYAHLSKIHVTTGQKVKQGVQVGAMGSTGRSTGTHLHFEVRLNGKAVNPRPFLEANTDVLKVQAVARQRTNAPKKRAEKSGSSRG